MFKFTLKFFAWIFGVIAALIIAVYLLFLIVNLHDQPPSELAKNFESSYSGRVKVPDHDNAFVYMMGLSVGQNENPKVWGAKRIALVTHATDEDIDGLHDNPIMQDYLYQNIRGPEIKKISDILQFPIDEKGFATLENNKKIIDEWVHTEAWLLDRYLELLTYHQYQEYVTIDANIPLPPYAAAMNAQKLFFANLWLQAERGNAAEVKNLLEKDAVYWRMSFSSSDTLISKMIATAALKRHFVLGNLILKKLSITTQINAIPENWKIAFTQTELGMLRTFNGEWIFQDRAFKKLKRKPDDSFYDSFGHGSNHWLANLTLPFLQAQDSSNQQAAYFKKLLDALDVPLDQYTDAIDDLEDKIEDEKEQQTEKINFHIYNITGNHLNAFYEAENGSSLYISYFSRVMDLEGIRQAAVLTSELRNKSLSVEAIPDYIEKSIYHNPYTLKPFEWDSESKAVKFTGLEAGERGNYSFAY